MLNLVPTRVFLTKGVGRHKYQLKSFEEALRKAGVAQQNLVQVSSILPPHCKIISKERGLKLLTPGGICHCVMARADTDEHGRLVASSVGIAVPKDETKWGYLSEVHGHGMNETEASDLAEDLAAGMLGTTLGLEVDPNKAWSREGASVQIQRPDHSHVEYHADRAWPERPLDHDGGHRHVPVRLERRSHAKSHRAMSTTAPANFGGLPPQYSGAADSRIVIVPVPYDGTSTWHKGADKGPAAILRASANLELYDIETDSQVYLDGIFTDEAVTEGRSPEAMVEAVRATRAGPSGEPQAHGGRRRGAFGEHRGGAGACRSVSRPERSATRRPFGLEK